MSARMNHQFKPTIDALEDRTFLSAGLIGNLQHAVDAGRHAHPEARRRLKFKKHAIKIGGISISIPTPVITTPTAPVVNPPAQPPVVIQSLGDKVKKFAMDRLGTKVGDGECATLADQALRAAGAKTFYQLGPTGPDADYVWGDFVKYFNDAKPGDIIQYRNVQIKETFPDGSWKTWSATHHTAIVSANLGNGKFQVLEQNVGPSSWTDAQKRIVQLNTIDFSKMTAGTVWIYHPKA